ncbi:MAG: CoA transferase [Hyphomicrobiales bacterium]|nr:CoA transferase [Hyphomicrobiales bacterium]
MDEIRHSNKGPLAGLKVIEFAGLGPAPLAGQLLADQGMEILVIDRQSGENFDQDPNRRGKRSIAINLKSSEGLDLVKKLISSADVLSEGFRPGVMERLGLGPDECMKINPRLIYARMTGWGQEGPLSSTSGHDLNYLATTGALAAMGRADQPPSPPLNLVADYGGGTMFMIFGILSAVIERQNSGLGQVVDVAMVDGVVAMMGMLHGHLARGLWENNRACNRLDGAAPYYRCYRCKDEKFIAVGCLEPQFFSEFVHLAKLPQEFLTFQRDKKRWPEMIDAITSRMLEKTRDEWEVVFEGSDGCVAPVLDWIEAPNHPHHQARDTYIELNGVTQTAPAPRFSRSIAGFPAPQVAAGDDTDDVLLQAGYGKKEIEYLRQTGVLT